MQEDSSTQILAKGNDNPSFSILAGKSQSQSMSPLDEVRFLTEQYFWKMMKHRFI